jgi:hypothetical protein
MTVRTLRTIVAAFLFGFAGSCQAIDNDPVLGNWDKKSALSKGSDFPKLSQKYSDGRPVSGGEEVSNR